MDGTPVAQLFLHLVGIAEEFRDFAVESSDVDFLHRVLALIRHICEFEHGGGGDGAFTGRRIIGADDERESRDVGTSVSLEHDAVDFAVRAVVAELDGGDGIGMVLFLAVHSLHVIVIVEAERVPAVVGGEHACAQGLDELLRLIIVSVDELLLRR